MHSFDVNLYWVEAYVKCSVLSSFMRGEAVHWQAKRACAHPRMYVDVDDNGYCHRIVFLFLSKSRTFDYVLVYFVFCGMVWIPLLVCSMVCVFGVMCFNFMMFSAFYYSWFRLYVFVYILYSVVWCGYLSWFIVWWLAHCSYSLRYGYFSMFLGFLEIWAGVPLIPAFPGPAWFCIDTDIFARRLFWFKTRYQGVVARRPIALRFKRHKVQVCAGCRIRFWQLCFWRFGMQFKTAVSINSFILCHDVVISH